MKKLLTIAVLLLIGATNILAQGELDEQLKVFFRNERTLAGMLNSDGLGFSYREAKRIDFLNKRYFEIEAGTLKHPKEYRIPNYYNQGGSFVFGKLNAPFYLRGSIGHQHEIYQKADLGGIAIRYFISGGPVIGIYKPIYYKVLYPGAARGEWIIKEEKFDVSIAIPPDIWSKASFFKGLGETRIMPGLFAKGGFNFEYSKEDKVIHAVEIGAQVNAFPKKIPIMAIENNKAVFFSLFVSYRFGVVVDPLNPETAKFSNLFRRQ
jgi:hypothetical protein